MADEQPIQNVPDDDSKKDTVRINLPPGLTGRGATPSPSAVPPPPPKPKAPGRRIQRATAEAGGEPVEIVVILPPNLPQAIERGRRPSLPRFAQRDHRL